VQFRGQLESRSSCQWLRALDLKVKWGGGGMLTSIGATVSVPRSYSSHHEAASHHKESLPMPDDPHIWYHGSRVEYNRRTWNHRQLQEDTAGVSSRSQRIPGWYHGWYLQLHALCSLSCSTKNKQCAMKWPRRCCL